MFLANVQYIVSYSILFNFLCLTFALFCCSDHLLVKIISSSACLCLNIHLHIGFQTISIFKGLLLAITCAISSHPLSSPSFMSALWHSSSFLLLHAAICIHSSLCLSTELCGSHCELVLYLLELYRCFIQHNTLVRFSC